MNILPVTDQTAGYTNVKRYIQTWSDIQHNYSTLIAGLIRTIGSDFTSLLTLQPADNKLFAEGLLLSQPIKISIRPLVKDKQLYGRVSMQAKLDNGEYQETCFFLIDRYDNYLSPSLEVFEQAHGMDREFRLMLSLPEMLLNT